MTSSSIPTTFPNTKLMSRKYFAGSALMDCLLVQTNVSSTSLPANTSDTCCLPKASPWPLTKSKSSKIGWNPRKSKTSSLSSDSPTSIVVSFLDTPKSLFRLHVLPARVPLGTSPSSEPNLVHSLTRRWDIYLKEGNSGYASVNPQKFRPVFTSEQLASSLQATTLSIPVLNESLIMDAEKLHSDIRSHLREDPISAEHLDKQSDSWTLDPDGLLRNSGKIYISDPRSLRLHVLQYSHDHPLAGHFGQMKTLHQVRRSEEHT